MKKIGILLMLSMSLLISCSSSEEKKVVKPYKVEVQKSDLDKNLKLEVISYQGKKYMILYTGTVEGDIEVVEIK